MHSTAALLGLSPCVGLIPPKMIGHVVSRYDQAIWISTKNGQRRDHKGHFTQKLQSSLKNPKFLEQMGRLKHLCEESFDPSKAPCNMRVPTSGRVQRLRYFFRKDLEVFGSQCLVCIWYIYMMTIINWVVATQIFLELSPRNLGKIRILTSIFFNRGWNHQLEYCCDDDDDDDDVYIYTCGRMCWDKP